MDMALEKEESEAEHERAKMYIQYLSNVYSQKQEGKNPQFERDRKEFEKMLNPQKERKETNKTYEWDFDPQELIEQQNT
ncbi:hypothetical protein [Oceanobacillus sp. FSL K6-0251]|uniref:hypothetical protein n=1 Tax=Oceanobacillus sp. FSL K6-0251 TaxID=2921602 RepID=UPI0030FC5D9E